MKAGKMKRETRPRTLIIPLLSALPDEIGELENRRGTLRLKDGSVVQISDDEMRFMLSREFAELFKDFGRWEIRWRQKKNRGPRSKYVQDQIEERFAGLPPGLKIAVQAEILGCSESTIHRLRRRKKS